MYLISKYNLGFLFIASVFLASCSASGDHPGLEYAPNMYHSVPYEPFSQITDIEAGQWVSSGMPGRGEYYNSNPINPYGMTMRQPPANTVKRGRGSEAVSLPYRIHPDSIGQAARTLRNPLEGTDQILDQGRLLYTSYCYPCHGGNGQGNGPVAPIYLGVASFTSDAVRNAPEGHIFHVITHGRGRMYPHGSQITVEDRWKIVHYVQTLQRQGNN
ncbi:cytochrome c [soil metagenome]